MLEFIARLIQLKTHSFFREDNENVTVGKLPSSSTSRIEASMGVFSRIEASAVLSLISIQKVKKPVG